MEGWRRGGEGRGGREGGREEGGREGGGRGEGGREGGREGEIHTVKFCLFYQDEVHSNHMYTRMRNSCRSQWLTDVYIPWKYFCEAA